VEPSPELSNFCENTAHFYFSIVSHTLNRVTMANLNLQEIHDFMISIAKQAGERIVAAKPTTEGAGSKKNCMYLQGVAK
jgi:hypothetical protein